MAGIQSSGMRITSRQWTSVSGRRTGDLLVVGEFALALVLIVSATLLIRSFLQLRAVELGFRPDHLLTMRIDLHVGRTDDQKAAYFDDAIRRAESIPGVLSAGAISGFLRTDPEDSVQIEGRPPQHPGPCEDWIAGRFFEAAGVPLKEGRVFSDRDRRGSVPVAVINETMARTYWPGGDPIGKKFRFRQSTPWITVVGVTGDVRRQGIDQPVAPQVFLPHRQGSEDMLDVIVRTGLDPGVMANIVQKEIQSLDKSVARFRITTVTQDLAGQTGERRFDTFLVSSFAMAALPFGYRRVCPVALYGRSAYERNRSSDGAGSHSRNDSGPDDAPGLETRALWGRHRFGGSMVGEPAPIKAAV